MRWRAGALDAAVAVGSFALSAGVLATSDPAAGDVRDPDAGAYVLAASTAGRPSSAAGRPWSPSSPAW